MRDLNREESYPPVLRAALDAWTASRVKAGAHGRVRWKETTYPWIEEQLAAGHLDELLAELAGLVDENKAKAVQRRADRRLSAAERLWERQAIEVDSWLSRKTLRRDLAGRNVWLWHGTSSALLPEIRRRGLLAEPPKKTHQSSTSGYIYLTTEAGDYGSGGSAVFYARSAAGKHGGDPVLLRVIVPWNELEPDADDEELSCGRCQFRTAFDIPVDRIREIGDERVGWPEEWPRYRNPISLHPRHRRLT